MNALELVDGLNYRQLRLFRKLAIPLLKNLKTTIAEVEPGEGESVTEQDIIEKAISKAFAGAGGRGAKERT